MRLRISLPTLSVPRTWSDVPPAPTGGSSLPANPPGDSRGSYGAIRSAKIAGITRTTRRTTAGMMGSLLAMPTTLKPVSTVRLRLRSLPSRVVNTLQLCFGDRSHRRFCVLSFAKYIGCAGRGTRKVHPPPSSRGYTRPRIPGPVPVPPRSPCSVRPGRPAVPCRAS